MRETSTGQRISPAVPTSAGHEPARAPRRSKLAATVRAMRPVQWVKNVLVFVPVVLAHQWSNMWAMAYTSLAFVALCACASAVYVINDVLDLQADRAHPTKSHRPFAAGELPVAWAPGLVVALLAFGLILSVVFLPWQFTAVLLLYLAVTTLYSVWLKRKVLIDVFTLAGLYTIRIFAGAVATDILVSEWLLAFSMFLFISAAFMKRYAELIRMDPATQDEAAGRGYGTVDISLIETMGIVSGYAAVLVFTLYIHSPEVTQLYAHRWALWLICPLLLYWVSRMWILAKRRRLTEDPLVFAIQDYVSLAIGAATVVLLLVAKGV